MSAARRSASRTATWCVAVFVGLTTNACRKDDGETDQGCYVPEPERETPPDRDAFCKWGTDEPDGPPGTIAHQYWTCVAVEAGTPCEDPCEGADEIDALLEEEIAKRCCEPIERFLRGCYARYEVMAGPDTWEECCYSAYYFSACTDVSEPLCDE
jgi:hypothetical protein